MAYWSQLLKLPDDRTAATAARLERQCVLRSGDHQFAFLLAEQALRTRIGTAEIMVEQLDRVLGVMALTNVSIGIIPATAGLGRVRCHREGLEVELIARRMAKKPASC